MLRLSPYEAILISDLLSISLWSMFTISLLCNSVVIQFALIMITKTASAGLTSARILNLPPPDISGISFTKEDTICSVDKTPFLAIILVLSHPGNSYERKLIRDLYPESEIAILRFRRVFVLAQIGYDVDVSTNITPVMDSVEFESERFADVMVLNYTESYLKLIEKSLSSFKWAVERCSHARFVVKADDDLFLDYYALDRYLRKVKDDDVDLLRGSNRPCPTCVTERLNGPIYLTSPRSLRLLVETAAFMRPLDTDEDTFITGTVADAASVVRRTFSEFGILYDSHCCLTLDGTVVYECEFVAFLSKEHKALTYERARRLKNHGRFCASFFCEKYSPKHLKTKGVHCFT